MHHAHRLDARVACRRAAALSIACGIGAVAPVAGRGTRARGRACSAIFCHSVAKWPVSDISTRSPGESVLTSAASHAPVPEAG